MTQMSKKTESMKKIEVSRDLYLKILIAVDSPSEEEKKLFDIDSEEFKLKVRKEIIRVADVDYDEAWGPI